MAKIKLPFTLDKPSSTEYAVGTDAVSHKSESLYDFLEQRIGENANSYATLDESGKIPIEQLPSFADDVVEGFFHDGNFYTVTDYLEKYKIPAESGKIYIDKETNISYRYKERDTTNPESVSEYIKILPALGETSTTAYRGDYGKIAYEHATELQRISGIASSSDLVKNLYKISITEEGHISSSDPVLIDDLVSIGAVNQTTVDKIKNAIGLNNDYEYTAPESGVISSSISIADALSKINTEIGNINTNIDNITDPEDITWSELKSLKDEGNLIPRKLYKITDYTCTTSSTGSRSANNNFDIVVEALNNKELNQNCKAVKKSGVSVFNKENLDKWVVMYDINNDTSLYDWADSISGKGVIWYLKDEYGNEATYDFKNIQFNRNFSDGGKPKPNYIVSDIEFYYTFSYINNAGVVFDLSCQNTIKDIVNWKCYNNKILSIQKPKSLPNNIFVGYNENTTNNLSVNNNIIFGSGNTFGGKNVYRNKLSTNVTGNVFYDSGNVFDNKINGSLIDSCIYDFINNTVDGYIINSVLKSKDSEFSGVLNGVNFNGLVSNSSFSGMIIKDTTLNPAATMNFLDTVSNSSFSGYICNSSFKKISFSNLTNYINKFNAACDIKDSNFTGFIENSTINISNTIDQIVGTLKYANINGYLGNTGIVATGGEVNYLKVSGSLTDSLITSENINGFNNLGVLKGCTINSKIIKMVNNFGILNNSIINTSLNNVDIFGTYSFVNFYNLTENTKKAESISYCNLYGLWEYVIVNIETTENNYGLFNYDFKGTVSGTSDSYKQTSPLIREISTSEPTSRVLDVSSTGDIVDYCIADIFALLSDN